MDLGKRARTPAPESRSEYHALLRDDRSGPQLTHFLGHFIHKAVVMVWIMMKDHERFDIGGVAQPHPLLPRRVTPALAAMEGLVGIHRIVDDDIGALHQVEDFLIRRVGVVLGIGQIADRPVVEFNPIAGRIVGVIERRGTNGDAGLWGNGFASVEIIETNLGLEYLERYRKQRRHHHGAKNFPNRMVGEEMTGPDTKFVLWVKPRNKERQPHHVVEMGVGEKEVGLYRRFFEEGIAEVAKAGTGIEHQEMIAAPDLQARRIAAISDGLRTCTSDTSANPPKANVKIFVVGQAATLTHYYVRSDECYMG